MLQQILKDMWVDPEILAGLDEEQKQILFCKMREEQVRRWKIWDEGDKNRDKVRNLSIKRNKKSVSFLYGEDGEPWVWVMGEHRNDKSIEEILKEEAIEKARELAEKETVELRKKMEEEILSDYIDLNTNFDKLQILEKTDNFSEDLYCSVDELKEQANNYGKIIQVNRKYNVIKSDKEILPKKVESLEAQKVREKVLLWETGKMEERTNEIFKCLQQKQMQNVKEAEEAEKKHEQVWKEQEKKAKEAEEHIRKVARKVREEYKRSSSDLEKIVINKDFNFAVPPNKEAVIQWYFKVEYTMKKAALDEYDNFEPWFHGLITRNEAENILNEEPVGSFLIRLSERIWGYALSYRGADKCKHYLISSKKKYRFLGKNHQEHDFLSTLINYHYTHPLTEGETLGQVCRPKNDRLLAELITI